MRVDRNPNPATFVEPVLIVLPPIADHPGEPDVWRGRSGRAALEQLQTVGRGCCVVLVSAEPEGMTVRALVSRVRTLAPGACLVRAGESSIVDPGFDRYLSGMPSAPLLQRLLDDAQASHLVRMELAVAREQLDLALRAHAALEMHCRAMLRWCARQPPGPEPFADLRRLAAIEELLVPLPRSPVALRELVEAAATAAGRRAAVRVTLGRESSAYVDPLLFRQAVEELLLGLPDAAWSETVRVSARGGLVVDCTHWCLDLAALDALLRPWQCDAAGQPLPLGLARAARLAELAGAPAEAQVGTGGRGVRIVLKCRQAALGPRRVESVAVGEQAGALQSAPPQ